MTQEMGQQKEVEGKKKREKEERGRGEEERDGGIIPNQKKADGHVWMSFVPSIAGPKKQT